MYADFMGLINEIESQFPVSLWMIDDIHLWPIFRFNLFFLNASVRKSKSKKVSRKTLGEKSKLLLESLRGLSLDFRASQLDGSKNDKLRVVDFVFLSQTNNRNSKVNSYWYDRVADPYITVIDDMNMSSLLLECSPSHEYRIPRYGRSVFIQSDINLCKIKSKLYRKKRVFDEILNLDEFGGFKDYLRDNQLNYFPDDKQLAYQVISIQTMSAYFLSVLRRVNPSAGFLIPYYWDIAMAFNLACKKLGIKSIDIQHGLQNEFHIAYARWNTVPPGGYGLLPSHFFCWSNFEVQLINQWSEGKTSTHRPIAVGNLGLELQLKEYLKTADDNINEIFISQENGLTEPTLNVLFTLQPIEDALPSWIIEAMQTSPQHWKWWLRLHPSMLSQYDYFDGLLHQHHLERVELKQASELPLSLLLAHTDVHVTQLSSVILEAEFCNVPSVMTDARASQSFPDQVRSGMALVATSSRTLIDAIAKQSIRSKNLKRSQNKDKGALIDNAKKILQRFSVQ